MCRMFSTNTPEPCGKRREVEVKEEHRTEVEQGWKDEWIGGVWRDAQNKGERVERMKWRGKK